MLSISRPLLSPSGRCADLDFTFVPDADITPVVGRPNAKPEGLQCAEGDDYNQWNIKRRVNEQLGDPGYLSLASAGREQRRLYRRMGSDYTGNPCDNKGCPR